MSIPTASLEGRWTVEEFHKVRASGIWNQADANSRLLDKLAAKLRELGIDPDDV